MRTEPSQGSRSLTGASFTLDGGKGARLLGVFAEGMRLKREGEKEMGEKD